MTHGTAVSGSFLGLMVGLLIVAVFMVVQPDLARAVEPDEFLQDRGRGVLLSHDVALPWRSSKWQ